MMTMVTRRALLTRMRVMTMKVTMTSDDDEDDNDGISHACDAGANNVIDNDYNSDHDTVGGHFDKTDGGFFRFNLGFEKFGILALLALWRIMGPKLAIFKISF